MKPVLEFNCPEKWKEMKQQVDGERYCQKCSTNLVDFTQMSDDDLKQYLEEGKYLCGIIETVQVDNVSKFNKRVLSIKLGVERKPKLIFRSLLVLFLSCLLGLSGCNRKTIQVGFVKSIDLEDVPG